MAFDPDAQEMAGAALSGRAVDSAARGFITKVNIPGGKYKGAVDAVGRPLSGETAKSSQLIDATKRQPVSGKFYLTGTTPNRQITAKLFKSGRTIVISQPGEDPDDFFQDGNLVVYHPTVAAYTGGPTTGWITESIAPANIPPGLTALWLVVYYGQSNSNGYSVQNGIVTPAPFAPGRVLMPSRGTRLTQQDTSSPIPWEEIADLRDCFEQVENLWSNPPNPKETPCSGFGFQVWSAGALAGKTALVMATAGVGGASIESLSKGTAPFAAYMRIVQRMNVVAQVANIPLVVPAVPYVQGEANIGAVGNTGYQTSLAQLQSDLDAGVKAITAQAQNNVLMGGQISSWFNASGGTIQASDTPIAIVNLQRLFPARFACFGPMYVHTYRDSLHLSTQDVRNYGETAGLGLVRFLASSATCLSLGVPTLSGAVVTVPIVGAEGSLSIDTGTVFPATNYGIEFNPGTGGNTPTISSVTVSGANLIVTLSAAPTGTGCKIESARTAAPGSNPGLGQGANSGPRTNIRDNATAVRADGSRAYKWLVTDSRTIS